MSKPQNEKFVAPPPSFIQSAASKVFGFDRLVRFYKDQDWPKDPGDFCQVALERFGVTLNIDEAELAQIPKKGPVVIVANHPFGAIEGLIYGALLKPIRPDVRVIANGILSQIQELQDFFIFVDPFETQRARKANIRPMMESLRCLKEGKALAMFPSGEVSHRNWKHWNIIDPTWNDSTAKLVRASKATVVPMCFEGSNGSLFQLAGLIHPRLRTVMLGRELWKRRHQTLTVKVGTPIPYSKLDLNQSDKNLAKFFRFRTYLLKKKIRSPQNSSELTSKLEKIVEPLPRDQIEKAIQSLPPEQHLGKGHGCSIYFFRKDQSSDLIHEIGRLREITFRGANEGTGKSIDIDTFDDTYFHLFVWHEEEKKMVGAYRLGPTDDILKNQSIEGLYTHTLFQYDPQLLQHITPGLEMGRSFVTADFQRHFWSLSLLWKGIGAFISRQPRYRYLFGPVSMSSGYSEFSRNCMIRWLRKHNWKDDLAKFVHPLQPPTFEPSVTQDGQDPLKWMNGIDDLSSILAEVEPVFKGVPILLKHYLNLGAIHLGFNVDPEFNNALDGLILVDLITGSQKTIKRFMGNEGYETFLNFHKNSINP